MNVREQNTVNHFFRLVWDFFGPDSQGTAEHFARHLRTRIHDEKKVVLAIDVEVDLPHSSSTFLDCDATVFNELAQKLRPHRVFQVEP